MHLLNKVKGHFHQDLTDPTDLQALRLAVEDIKLKLTNQHQADLNIDFHSLKGAKNVPKSGHFSYTVTRKEFEGINMDLFKKTLEPIETILHSIDLPAEWVDEIVLVGGSTRIPKIRELIAEYFEKIPNTSVDPELAVASGVAIQAGIIGGMWPLTVSATELPSQVQKIHLR